MEDIMDIITRGMEATLVNYREERVRLLGRLDNSRRHPASHVVKWVNRLSVLDRQIPVFEASIKRRIAWVAEQRA